MPVNLPNVPRFLKAAILAAGVLLLALPSSLQAGVGTADEQWQHIQALRQQLSGDAPPGVNEVEWSVPIKTDLHHSAAEFVSEHPDDPHFWDAKLLVLKTVIFPTPIPERKVIFSQQENLLASILSAPQAPPAIKQQAERALISEHLDHLDLIDTPAQASELEARIVRYIHEHPDDPKANALQVRRLDLLQKIDPKKEADLLATLENNDDPKVAAAARGRGELKTLESTPLDWKFTAVDGRPVDLADWRGKVVLVDFWASWCPDCLREMPEVLAAYHQYHDKGFEVVGVSMDHDKAAMVAFLKKHNIPWPQQYDGQAWDSSVAVKYGVKGIPEMWLLDRTGRVVATGVHGSQLDAELGPLFRPQAVASTLPTNDIKR